MDSGMQYIVQKRQDYYVGERKIAKNTEVINEMNYYN
jgi:hypothetical protein